MDYSILVTKNVLIPRKNKNFKYSGCVGSGKWKSQTNMNLEYAK
jgi:hypothetical protein